MRLPKSVQEIADVIGRERALYLIGQLPRCISRDKRYPGATSSHVMLYVPTVSRLRVEHELVRILGWNEAVKLCRAFGGEILQPANCSEIYINYRNRMIDKFLRDGMKPAYVAATLGLSERHIRNIGKEIPQEELPQAANDNAPTKRKARAANEPRRQRG